LLTMTGCISSSTLIRLNADGSGTIEQTILLGSAFVEQMKQMMTEMAAAFGGEGQQAEEQELFPEAEFREGAAELGEGVRFVSHQPIKTEESEGVRVVYAFDDVTKLHISQKPSPPSGPGQQAAVGEREDLRFRFERAGGRSILTVLSPEPQAALDAGSAEPETTPPESEVDPEELAQMQQMFKGLRIDIAVEVAGKLIRTTSPYVDGSRVTLLEMDFEAFLDDPEKLKALAAPGAQDQSLEAMKRLLRDIPGIKVILDPEITIEFAG
ncbi:MAG: hypothetical protein GY856_40280, partial [bacterium]|nr:hypothetical protein [bacterium]